MTSEPLPATDEFRGACETIGVELSEGEIARLGRFLHLLLETNKKFNLTAIKEPEQAWMRHALDSLSLLPFLMGGEDHEPQGPGRLIDVGSGGGLPGIPLAIALPDLGVTLLESTGKKARFCESAVNELGLENVSVVADRAETAAHQHEHRERYGAAVGRAIGPMNVLLELTLPLVRVGGRALAMKGKSAEDELRDAGDALMLLGAGNVHVWDALPGVEEEAVIVEVEKLGSTPEKYPRRPGEPKKNPL